MTTKGTGTIQSQEMLYSHKIMSITMFNKSMKHTFMGQRKVSKTKTSTISLIWSRNWKL